MNCPRCGREMSIGSPHDLGHDYQYECTCGYIIPMVRDENGM